MYLFRADLHIHTVLSPCGDLEMGAPDIISKVKEQKLNAIAVTDHNIASNYPALADAAKKLFPDLLVIPGVEVQTVEDIHVVALFPDYSHALEFQKWLHMGLPEIKNAPEIFGDQFIIDQENSIIGEFDILLIQGVSYSIDEVLDKIRSSGGLSILAHIDRPSFSYPSVLGPVPNDLRVDALEISKNVDAKGEMEYCRSYPDRIFVRSSDAHCLRDINAEYSTTFHIEEMSFTEIAKAFDPQVHDRKVLSLCGLENN